MARVCFVWFLAILCSILTADSVEYFPFGLVAARFASYVFTNSPEGKMMLSFALSQSKYQSEKLGIDEQAVINGKPDFVI